MKYLFLILIIAVALIFYLQPHSNLNKIQINSAEFQAEIASSPSERAQGLSGRTSLPENAGMLFVFEKPGVYGFWMKDMQFPIDIIWIGENKKIIYIKKNATPDSYPASFASPEPAKYVLEINAGLCDVFNIKVGDIAVFE